MSQKCDWDEKMHSQESQNLLHTGIIADLYSSLPLQMRNMMTANHLVIWGAISMGFFSTIDPSKSILGSLTLTSSCNS